MQLTAFVTAEVGVNPPSYDELLLDNQQLREQNARLQQTIRELQQRVDELERSVKRQAAPFSKGPPKKNPKKPGRKTGPQHGKHGHRLPPAPDKIDAVLDAPLPERCPDCDGQVVEDHCDKQYQTEIPRQPITRQFNIHCGHCQKCSKTFRGRHPLQTSAAVGAAQSQLGGDAQAAVVYLNKHAGLSHGKIADTFAKLFGIALTPGASAHIVLRAGRLLEPVCAQIRQRIKDSKHLTPDETGWRIGGKLAWLHTCVGDDGVTLYAIDRKRSAEVLEKVIGSDWSGNMTHDGFSSYDRFQTDVIHQQCVDHALRRARNLVAKQVGAAKEFPQQVVEVFTEALQLRDRLNEEKADSERRGAAYAQYSERLEALTRRRRRNAQNARFAKHLDKHSNEWFPFLLDQDIPATNHRAEQALKTPIVNRKVWGGNRTTAGGEAQANTCSVLQTCKNKAMDAFGFLSDAFRGVLGNLFAAGNAKSV
jgi:transposase